jgi:hypothetical protein
VFAGEPQRAIEALQANLRLDPFQSASRLAHLGHAYYMLKRYTEAVPPLRECAARLPNYQIVHLWLPRAPNWGGTRRRGSRPRLLRIDSGFTIDRWKCTATYKNPKDAEHMFDGLRKAGLPED